MRLKGFFLLVYLTMAFMVMGQRSRIDSLLQVEEKHQFEDSTKLKIYIELMREYRKLKQPDQRFLYAHKAIDLAEKIKFLRLIYPVYNVLGLRNEGIGEFEKSIKYYNRGIELAQQFHDLDAASDYRVNLGTVYQSMGDFSKIMVKDNKSHMVLISLKNLEKQLSPSKFMRVHKQFMVNLEQIVSISNADLKLSNQQQIPVSTVHKQLLMDQFINKRTLSRFKD